MKSQGTMLLFAGMLVLVIIGGYFLARTSDGPAPGGQQLRPGTMPSPSDRPSGDAGTPAAPTNPDLSAGIEALGENRLDDARESLEKVSADDPGYLVALLNLGLVHEAAGDLDAAEASFRKIIFLNPEDPNSYVALGNVFFRRGHYADAENAVLRGLELQPRNARARYDVGLYRIAQGLLRRGVNAYTRAMKEHDSPKIVMQALDDLREFHDAKPDFADAHYALAFFANSMGRKDEEIRELEHYLELDPNSPIADLARANLDKARGSGATEQPEAADPTP